ncbi:iron-sulfur cluster [Micromonas commoda]|uniref:Iron-sulfur cluster n=1 Tax=Micromonas commoda (strain RCC299 / NOUM17 / CCMP2709) TaxID=296587 RepID=C1FJI7_MICCC|nr:iron-sulfur cluster [Micromonas commoda]ACO70354.1 iron-sulfur cluster [Micromonas commoda]|eukprot:XP_002509096.1 iron-sulfur cluster [Micromonas commoda]
MRTRGLLAAARSLATATRRHAVERGSRTESWRPWVTAPPTDVHRVDSWNRAGIATSAGAREAAARAAAEAGVEDPDGKSDGITLTDACVRRLRELAAEDPAASILRVAVDGGGCSGYQYTFSLDTTPAPRDRVFDVGGARVVVDEISFEFVKGSTVDYVEEMIRSSFAIADNPNAEGGCGCGSSFVAK